MFEPVKGELIDATQLYTRLINNGYKKGTPIRLITCHSGSKPTGGASRLAKILEVKVEAPTNAIRILEDGTFEVAKKGKLVIFEP